MDKVSAQTKVEPQIITPQKELQLPNFKIILAVLVVLILLLGGFNFALDRYGKFWEKIGPLAPGPTPTSAPTLKLTCPVPEEFCQQARSITEGTIPALGFNLPPGSSVSAVFAGRIERDPQYSYHPDAPQVLFLKDSQGNEAIYSFFGEITVPFDSEVTLGQTLGKIDNRSFPPVAPFIGLNSLFSLKKDGKFIPLALGDFGK